MRLLASIVCLRLSFRFAVISEATWMAQAWIAIELIYVGKAFARLAEVVMPELNDGE